MRSSGPRLFVTCTGIACAVTALAAKAAAQDAATAGALFDRGVADMQAGHFGTGCPAIAESQRLDPRPGTLFTLAECEAKWGKVASAVAHYEEYLGLVSRLPADQQKRHQSRVEMAEGAVRRIKPSVPMLTLVLPRGAPEGSVVTRDGVVLQGAALGVALPVDPGEHVVVTRATGGAEREQRVSVALGEAKRVELELTPAGSLAAPAPSPTAEPGTDTAEASAAPLAADAGAAPESSDQPPRSGSSQRTWGWIVSGVGAAGVAVGSVTGVLVLLKKGTVNEECDGQECSPTGKAAADSGKQLGLISDIGFAVGAAGLVGGVVLLLTAPKSAPPAPSARRLEPLLLGDRSGAWAGVRGTF